MLGLSFEPLIGAISAGNCAVIKPSELAPASSALLVDLVRTYLDPKAVKVIEGGVSVCEQLLQQKWDKILFTGLQYIAYRPVWSFIKARKAYSVC